MIALKFNEIIKDLREKRDITAREVSEAIGVSTSAYLNYERGERQPNFETLCKLADFYHVTADYLLGRNAPPPVTLEKLLADKKDMSEMEKRFILVYVQLDKKHREAFVKALEEAAHEGNKKEEIEPIVLSFPLHCLKASAGTGFELDDEYLEPALFTAEDGITEDDGDFAVEVYGDSMEPDYPDGCFVLIRKYLDGQCPSYGDTALFMCCVDGEWMGYIKQWREGTLHSINPDYSDLTPEEIRPVGEVVCILSKV